MRNLRLAANAEGFIFFFACIALGAAAIGSGKNGLMLLFCTLAAAFILFSIIARRNISQPLKIERRFAEEIFAGNEAHIDLIVTNLGNIPVFGIHIYEKFEDGRTIGPIFIPRLNPGQTSVAKYVCMFPNRGHAHFCGFEIRSAFPLPFAELRKDIPVQNDILVYPEPIDGTEQIEFSTAQDDSRPQISHQTDTSIRELIHGRRVGRILWKLSARRQIWLEAVPIRKKNTSGIPAIILQPKQILGPERFEKQISQVTGFVLDQIQNEKHGEIQIEHISLPYGKTPQQRQKILETLASI